MSETVTVKILRDIAQHKRGALVDYDRPSAEFLVERDVAELVDEQPARAKRQPSRALGASTPSTVTDSDDPGE
ncbi:hypothetical protein [Longispora albida]|uniref:hypothetical protein n=1 Tax=Longispora albida TaxID=203523 RepID=UPI000370417B|nr:hypothetical protein [Longispora albida]